MGKDQFVKLLVAQMTHQDPLNPMDSTQMAAQLAQFSSVEQLMNINTTLAGQANGNTLMLDALDRNAALGMIGRTVTAVSDEVTVSGHAASAVQADIPSAGAHVRVRIVDATGKELGSNDYGVLAGGRRTLDLSQALKDVPNGSYTIKVESLDDKGGVAAMSAIQQFKIDGLKFGTNGAVLTSGTRAVPIGNVIGVASN
jgi:flagellar basal-body rod modification protein FlgD